MTFATWLALFVALVVAAEAVRALRHRGLRKQRAGAGFFRQRTTRGASGF